MLCEKCSAAIADPPAKVNTPVDLAKHIYPLADGLKRERFWVITLNTKNEVMAIEELYRGTVNAAQIRPAEIFQPAIIHDAPAIAIAHNHPSGNVTPSPEDVALTDRVVQAGKIMDIEVVDHVVVNGSSNHLSMRERGLGFA